MRVTEQAQFNRTVSTIKRNYNELEASQTRLSTGQRVHALTRMLLQLLILYIIELECLQ